MAGQITVQGIRFDSVSLEEAVARCRAMLETDGVSVIHTPNAEIAQMCREHPEYLDVYNDADLIIPDGIGVIAAARILGTPLTAGKVAGIDLCRELIVYCAQTGYGVFLLGGRPGVAEEAAAALEKKYIGLHICGVHDGYFTDDRPVIQKINESGADLLLVCLGVPKQELWIAAHRQELTGVRLTGGFGGTLDVFAGRVRRAPQIFIRLGLEWLYRLIREPRRIRRMMKIPKFLAGTVRCRLRGSRHTVGS